MWILCQQNNIFPQLLPSLIATLSAISDGMHYGWSAPVFPLLRLSDSAIKITHFDETWLEALYSISTIAGVPLTTFLNMKIGPKKSILVASFFTALSWIVTALARKVEWLYIARFLAGMASNTAYVSIPMYISELAHQNVRGFLIGLDYLMTLVGLLMVYSIAPFAPIYVPPVVGVAFSVVQFFTLPLMPESPYYLVNNGKMDKARLALGRLRSDKDSIDEELREIALAMERQNCEKGQFLDLVAIDSNRKAVIIATVLVLCQNFSGLSIILMNMHTILMKSESIYMSTENTAIVFSLLMVIAATICVFSVDKIGRKVLLIVSGVLTGVCLLVLSIFFTLKYSNIDMENVSWIPVVSVMVFAVTFKIGIGFLPQVIISELFPNNVKTMGLTLGDVCFTVFSFLSIIFYQYISHSFRIDIALYVLAIVAFVSAIFTSFYVPETKGKTLDEIQLMLKGQK